MDYICGYCGKSYPTIGERMECERKCHEKKAQEEEKLKASKREEEMKKDYDVLRGMINERDKFDEKVREYSESLKKKYRGVSNESYITFSPFDLFFRF